MLVRKWLFDSGASAWSALVRNQMIYSANFHP